MDHDRIGSLDLRANSMGYPQGTSQRVRERHRLRSQRRRSVDVAAVAKTNDLDPLADQGLTPSSRGIGGPGLASAELMLIVNDPDRFPPCVALRVARRDRV